MTIEAEREHVDDSWAPWFACAQPERELDEAVVWHNGSCAECRNRAAALLDENPDDSHRLFLEVLGLVEPEPVCAIHRVVHQPREHAVPCTVCGVRTFDVHGRCANHDGATSA